MRPSIWSYAYNKSNQQLDYFQPVFILKLIWLLPKRSYRIVREHAQSNTISAQLRRRLDVTSTTESWLVLKTSIHLLVVSMFTGFIHLRDEVNRTELVNFLLFTFYILRWTLLNLTLEKNYRVTIKWWTRSAWG